MRERKRLTHGTCAASNLIEFVLNEQVGVVAFVHSKNPQQT